MVVYAMVAYVMVAFAYVDNSYVLLQESSVLLCIVSGMIDRVARKAPREFEEGADRGKRWSKIRNLSVPYTAACKSTPGVLHVFPGSTVYTKDGASVSIAV